MESMSLQGHLDPIAEWEYVRVGGRGAASSAMDVPVGDDHPLALELASLRTAVARYQHEAHETSVKLQRHSLETSHALERAHWLEAENVQLKEELAVLRAHPETLPHPASLQVQELTLAHRRLSDKLTLTDEALHARTTELAHARSDLAKSQHDIDAVRELAARTQAQLEEAQAKEREVERKARAAEEERKLADLVVQEYADLVRTLEGRSRPATNTYPLGNTSNNSSTTLVDSLSEGKTGLQKLLEELNGETERLEAETSRLHGELGLLSSLLEAERKRAEHDRAQLIESQTELEKYRLDDNTAGKMVSRYMKFSQSSTNRLQKAMEDMKARHAAMTATLHTELEHLRKSLTTERRQSEKLRSALDELTEDISRESYGRRREISLRLAFLGREENLAEGLRRWIRRAREAFDRALAQAVPAIKQQDPHTAVQAIRRVFDAFVRDADGLLESLNGQPEAEDDAVGSLARIIAAHSSVLTLTRELQAETDRRLHLERQLAFYHVYPESTDLPSQAQSTLLPAPSAAMKGNASHHKFAIAEEQPKAGKTTEEQSIRLVDQDVEHGSSETAYTLMQVSAASTPITESHQQVSSRAEEADVTEPAPATVETTQATLVERDDIAGGNGTDEHSHPATISAVVLGAVASTPEHSPASDMDHPLFSFSDPQESSTRQVDEVEHSTTTEVNAGRTSIETNGETGVSPPEAKSEDGAVPFIQDILLQTPHLRDKHNDTDPTSQPPPETSSLSAQAPKMQVTPVVINPTATTASTAEKPSVLIDVFSPTVSSSPLDELKISPLTSQSLNGLPPTEKYALLPELLLMKRRYDTLQRGFRDCNLALKEMKKELYSLPRTSDQTFALEKAVERLDDFNEDARVELEIRITDEARIISGYEALLTIPGAMSDEVDEAQIEAEIKAFIEGTDKAVAKAVQLFTRKLDDLEHDIASVKRALHDMAASAELSPEGTPAKSSPSWSSWTTGLLSPSRPASPAPTFGSVMTSPRLRQSSFSHPRKASSDSSSPDPFASLGLRIPMPSHVVPTPAPMRVVPRPRVSSGTYMLGLGARGHSFGLGAISGKPAIVRSLGASSSALDAVEGGDEEGLDVE